MTAEQELAWAAGLFEGEGCMSTFGVQHLQRMTLASMDEDVVRRFHSIIGAGVVDRQPGPNGALWRWRVQTPEATEVMRTLLPFMGVRRRARAEELLAIRETHIERVTHARVCPMCCVTFRPRYSPNSERQKFCSVACGNAGQNARKREETACRS